MAGTAANRVAAPPAATGKAGAGLGRAEKRVDHGGGEPWWTGGGWGTAGRR